MVDIFQEVDEELRQDRLQKFWKLYGRFVIAGVVFTILVAASWRLWDHYSMTKVLDASHQYQVAENLLREGKFDDALALFSSLSEDGFGAYQQLGEIRQAALLKSSGNVEAAEGIYKRISQDTSQNQILRDSATLNLVVMKLEEPDQSLEKLISELRHISKPDRPLRFSALEILGLLEIKRGNKESAEEIYKKLAENVRAPGALRERAARMLTVLNGH